MTKPTIKNVAKQLAIIIAGMKNSMGSFFAGISDGKKSSRFIRLNKYPKLQPTFR